MSKKAEYIRIIGIDPSYAKGITYCVVKIQTNLSRGNYGRIKYECHGTVKGNSPVMAIELLKEVEVNGKIRSYAVIEDCYHGVNPQTTRKLALVIGSIMNFMERNQVDYELILNMVWEKELYRGVRYNEKRKLEIKKALIKQDFAQSLELNKIGIDTLNDDEVDAFVLARYGALKISRDYMLAQSG